MRATKWRLAALLLVPRTGAGAGGGLTIAATIAKTEGAGQVEKPC